MKKHIAIIGGGAAGFFSAIHAKENYPEAQVYIYEKSKKLLSKVKVSGGGRCNVTNGAQTIKELTEAYPRGAKQLRKIFGVFDNHHAMEWFESRGVPLTIQDDNCVFPVSQDSQSIIDCFLNQALSLGVEIKTEYGVQTLTSVENQWELTFQNGTVQLADSVIIATGGSPKRKGLEWLEKIGHTIADPVPSLFTFNMPNESVRDLMGIVVEKALVNIQGTKLKGDGPLLITHWGMSGPAILKLSAFGARILEEKNYNFKIQVNWVNETNNDNVLNTLQQLTQDYTHKQLANIRPYYLPVRLWHYLLEKCSIDKTTTWGQLGKKTLNKLMTCLTNDIYEVSGKTTFKEEFVTCGGVALENINIKTMQSKVCPGLYFCGEVLDIDGITGGYNFQAAWTTAYVAGKLLDSSK